LERGACSVEEGPRHVRARIYQASIAGGNHLKSTIQMAHDKHNFFLPFCILQKKKKYASQSEKKKEKKLWDTMVYFINFVE